MVWVRIGNTRRAELLRRFGAEFPAIVEALEQGETLVDRIAAEDLTRSAIRGTGGGYAVTNR